MAPREVFNFRFGIEIEGVPQFGGVRFIPGGEKGLRVAHEFGNRHPIGQVAIFGQVADASQRADGIRDGIEAEDADRARLGLEQAEHVLDDGRLAGPVAADQAEHSAPRDRERNLLECSLIAEVSFEPANLDHVGGRAI